jgi:hypothetical protein|tara:strand:+ start:94 stop:348 length:255 start_codon:yes stop_codon:yes gene_type:complete
MNNAKGKIIKKGEFFYLEKNYDDISLLLNEEEKLIDKIENNNFIYLDNTVSICKNPNYNLDKLYRKKTSKIKYKNTFKLMHVGL